MFSDAVMKEMKLSSGDGGGGGGGGGGGNGDEPVSGCCTGQERVSRVQVMERRDVRWKEVVLMEAAHSDGVWMGHVNVVFSVCEL